MRRRPPLFAAAALVVTCSCAVAHAVYPFWIPYSPPQGSFRVRVGGADLFTESVDALAYGPDGTLYAVDNILGTGSLYKISGSNYSQSSTLIGLPHGLTYGPDGKLYATSTGYGGTPTGVLQYDPITLQYNKNAIPLTAANSPSDVAFGPGGYMYVATSNAVIRYTSSTLQKDTNYTVPLSSSYRTSIGFLPGNNDLFLIAGAQADRIDEFDPTGSFVKTLIPAGTSGMGHICDFTVGIDGTFHLIDRTGSGSPLNHLFRFDASGNYVSSSAIEGQGGYSPIAVFPSAEFVPEPASAALLAAVLPLLLRRRKLQDPR